MIIFCVVLLMVVLSFGMAFYSLLASVSYYYSKIIFSSADQLKNLKPNL